LTGPRARTRDGHGAQLGTYTAFAADDLLGEVVMERMLPGWRPAATAPPASRSAPGQAAGPVDLQVGG
jgi:hypothetical protein